MSTDQKIYCIMSTDQKILKNFYTVYIYTNTKITVFDIAVTGLNDKNQSRIYELS